MAGPVAAGFMRSGRGQRGGLAAGLAVNTRHVGMLPEPELDASKVAAVAAKSGMSTLIRDAAARPTQRLDAAERRRNCAFRYAAPLTCA